MRRRHRHEAGRRVVLQHVRGAGVPVGGQFVERNPTSGDPVLVDVDHREQHASRDLLREILCSEEDHIDWLETQLSLIEAVGLQNYLQSQMDE